MSQANVKQLFLLKTVNLGYVLLRYVLIYNLEVSFHFHLTFLQLNVIKVFTVFYLTLGYFLRTPDNSNLFSISLEGSRYRKSTVYYNFSFYFQEGKILSNTLLK